MDVKSRIIIEILGSPEEHVKKVINEVMAELEKRDIKILNKEVSEPKKVERFYSTFAEVEFKCKNLIVLTEDYESEEGEEWF